MADPSRAGLTVKLEVNLGTVAVVYANMRLALQHQHNRGPTREIAERFVGELEDMLVMGGMYTRAEINRMRVAANA
jgi:hypothetical protein